MGVCGSCFGRRKPPRLSESDETARLLGDSFEEEYGIFDAEQAEANFEADMRKRQEALEQLCISTFQKFVDANSSQFISDIPTDPAEIEKLITDVFNTDAPTTDFSDEDSDGESVSQTRTQSDQLTPLTTPSRTASSRVSKRPYSDDAEENVVPERPHTSPGTPTETCRSDRGSDDGTTQRYRDQQMASEKWLRDALLRRPVGGAAGTAEFVGQRMKQSAEKQGAVWDVLYFSDVPLCISTDIWDQPQRF